MSYSEIKGMYRKVGSGTINYFCIDMAQNKSEGNYRIFNGNQNTNIE